MKKMIIGIHGLKNKPAQNILKKWWIQSIKDGLHCLGEKEIEFEFEQFYWADFNYSKPLDETITNKESPYYVKNPYQKVQQECYRRKHISLKKKILERIEIQMDKLLLKETSLPALEKIQDLTLRKMFLDLDTYYHGNCRVKSDFESKTAMRKGFAELLRKHKHKKIMVIAHSMGGIIAYDTFSYLTPTIPIHTFITCGSPLGVPLVMKKILQEQHLPIHPKTRIATPECLTTYWFNLSDLDDKICVNYNLADDYHSNNRQVGPLDMVVKNLYEYKGERNPHKIYGYLQTPEMAKLIFNFLSETEKKTLWERVRTWLGW
jgi:hypothetical protein